MNLLPDGVFMVKYESLVNIYQEGSVLEVFTFIWPHLKKTHLSIYFVSSTVRNYKHHLIWLSQQPYEVKYYSILLMELRPNPRPK